MYKNIIIGTGLIACLTLGLTGCSNSTATTKTRNQQATITASHQTTTPSKNKSRSSKNANKSKTPIYKNAILLHLLKMDPISLEDEIKSGKSIVDIAKEKNITEDQMINALIQPKINNMKKKGKTDSEINTMKTQWENKLKKALEKTPKIRKSKKTNA